MGLEHPSELEAERPQTTEEWLAQYPYGSEEARAHGEGMRKQGYELVACHKAGEREAQAFLLAAIDALKMRKWNERKLLYCTSQQGESTARLWVQEPKPN